MSLSQQAQAEIAAFRDGYEMTASNRRHMADYMSELPWIREYLGTELAHDTYIISSTVRELLQGEAL